MKRLAYWGSSIAVGLTIATVVDATLLADGGDGERPIEYSYDAGSGSARVFAYCIGSTGIYLLADTDEMRTEPSDENCAEGGFLRDEDNDRQDSDD